ncbi:antitoxin (DNA-binding transcriptional repressor) of toxin-antitoxin stability system [Sphingomonas sp. BE138]|uniref:type II toxin-antitoxin system Phd/YefM family antitoxin n=1 Tax=Sphingomonas sp. BE138 TaxID=2817845 RepID=UPI00285E547D|nr:prevent-host-death protein [Sphingomonas sp. BE138]MDR6788371.1 antitoxin (DNA-binding transcriptional repressor) of toxin-antitoxin stability system [Sphingomonas sp. BE138]
MGKMVGISEFKTKCIALLEEMERSGEPLTITRRGKPSLTLSAREAVTQRPKLFGSMKGTVTVHGDIVGPVDPDWEVKWNAKWDERGFPVRTADEAS